MRLRWVCGSDSSDAAIGWYVDSVTISDGAYSCCAGLTPTTIVNPRRSGTSPVFSFQSINGQTYRVESQFGPGKPGLEFFTDLHGGRIVDKRDELFPSLATILPDPFTSIGWRFRWPVNRPDGLLNVTETKDLKIKVT